MIRILSLDDEPEMLDLLSLILEPLGYEHLKTTNSAEALLILRNEPVGLFTQDFMRPKMDGCDFLRRMKSDETLRDIPVLGISAGTRETRAEQLKQVGLDIDGDLDGYVTKPFGPCELLEAIAHVLTRRGVPLPPKHAILVESPLAALKHDDARVRTAAAWILGRDGDAGAVEPLIRALADDAAGVRRNAAEALGKIGDARAVEPLTILLADDVEWVREQAAWALGEVGDVRAVEPLATALTDDHTRVRMAVVKALGKIDDVRTIELLTKALTDESEWVRKAAAEALGQVKRSS